MVRALIPLLLVAGCIENKVTPVDPDGENVHDTDGEDFGEDTGDPFADDGLGDLSGRICSPNNGIWVGGAKVWIETETGLVQTYTDSDGYFLLRGIEPGIHHVFVQKGSFHTEFDVEIFEDFETKLAAEECLGPDVEIAIVTGVWDHLQYILDRMSLSDYDLVDGISSGDHVDFFRDPERLAQYDIIMLNCGMDDDAWITHRAEIILNLRDFVEGGGSVYASDMSYFLLEGMYPGAVDYNMDDSVLYDANKLLGPAHYTGEIKEEELQVALGSDEATLVYEGNGLYAVADTVGEAEVLMEADYTWWDFAGAKVARHGVVGMRYRVGGGQIMWTSFHNEYQYPTAMDPLLEQLVLSL